MSQSLDYFPEAVVGPAGADGKSAYDLAVESGFVGTLAQWLASLEGADGPAGANGAAGIQGPQGLQGPQGVQGPAGTVAPIAANTVLGNNTAGTAAPIALTPAQARTLLDVPANSVLSSYAKLFTQMTNGSNRFEVSDDASGTQQASLLFTSQSIVDSFPLLSFIANAEEGFSLSQGSSLFSLSQSQIVFGNSIGHSFGVNATGYTMGNVPAFRTLLGLGTSDSPTFANITASGYASAASTATVDSTDLPGFRFDGNNSRSIRYINTGTWGNSVGFCQGNNYPLNLIQGGVGFITGSNAGFKWSSVANTPYGTIDTQLTRQSAGVVQIGTTANNALGSLACASALFGGSTDNGFIGIVGSQLTLGSNVSAIFSIGQRFGVDDALLKASAAGGFAWSFVAGSTNSADLILRRDAAGTLGLRNGTNAQRFNIYGTIAGSDLRRMYFSSTTAGAFTIGVEGAGTGASGNTLDIGNELYKRTSTAGNLATGHSILRWQTTYSSNTTANIDSIGGLLHAGMLAIPNAGSASRTAIRLGNGGARFCIYAQDYGFPTEIEPSGKLLAPSFTFRNTLDTANADIACGAITASGTVSVGTFTVATLPSASANSGMFAQVTDSSVTANGSAVAAGGANRAAVFSNGTTWDVVVA
jgi:hypothetical protein